MIDFSIITASPQLRTPPFTKHSALPFPPTHAARQTPASMLLCVLKFSHTYGNSSPAPLAPLGAGTVSSSCKVEDSSNAFAEG